MTHRKIVTEGGLTHRTGAHPGDIIDRIRNADPNQFLLFTGYGKNKDRHIKAGNIAMVTEEK